MLRRTLFAFVLAGAFSAQAQAAQPPSYSSDDLDLEAISAGQNNAARTFEVQWDNDWMGGQGQDQGYTNGADFALTAPSDGFQHPAIERLATLGLGHAPERTVSFGQKMYTPDDVYRYTRPLVEDDRPYAAWLYLGYARHAFGADELRTSRWDVGLVGPGAGGETTQDQVHRWLARGRFAGWDNQLHNELTLQWSHERAYRLAGTHYDYGRNHAIEAGWYASAGTPFTHVGGRAQWRWGQGAQSVFSTSRGNTVSMAPGEGWVWYGFLEADVQAVAYNTFLNGNAWESSHGVDPRTFVGQARAGLAIENDDWRFGIERNWHTREFDGQLNTPAAGTMTFTRRY